MAGRTAPPLLRPVSPVSLPLAFARHEIRLAPNKLSCARAALPCSNPTGFLFSPISAAVRHCRPPPHTVSQTQITCTITFLCRWRTSMTPHALSRAEPRQERRREPPSPVVASTSPTSHRHSEPLWPRAPLACYPYSTGAPRPPASPPPTPPRRRQPCRHQRPGCTRTPRRGQSAPGAPSS